MCQVRSVGRPALTISVVDALSSKRVVGSGCRKWSSRRTDRRYLATFAAMTAAMNSASVLLVQGQPRWKRRWEEREGTTNESKLLYYYSCGLKCKIDAKKLKFSNAKCTGEFVDCSKYGGYDPIDPCKQNCIFKKQIRKDE